nr:GNAT family N-acetyltransferase [uncultured Acetatifactor sp.]
MLKTLTSVNEYLDFINEINSDPNFSDPMLSSQEEMRCNLLDAPGKPANHIWGVFEEDRIIGLFVFLILEEESYIEMLAGLSRVPKAYKEMLSFLKDNYKGCKADFVYNPANHLLHNLLLAEKTEFEAEQQKMVLKRDVPCQSCHKIQLYSPQYREQYLALHSDDGYWTAEKVIDASDRFRILLALEEDTVVGYMDITHKFEENEPFDFFVKEEYRRRGYGRAILAKAIELNRPKAMMLLVDTDNTAAISLYESLGFDRFAGGNNITAHVSL